MRLRSLTPTFPPLRLPHTPSDIATHKRLWRNIPSSLWPMWIETCRPSFRAYSVASVSRDPRQLMDALVRIVNIPRTALIRSRGGLKKKKRALRLLEHQLRASQNCSQDSLLSILDKSDDTKSSTTSSRIPRAVALIQQGYVSRATRSLFQKDLSVPDQKAISLLESLHPPASDAVPPLPPDTPSILNVDDDVLAKLIKMELLLLGLAGLVVC